MTFMQKRIKRLISGEDLEEPSLTMTVRLPREDREWLHLQARLHNMSTNVYCLCKLFDVPIKKKFEEVKE